MDRDNKNSKFDIDNDPDFNENFYKNIEKVLGDTSAFDQETEQKTVIESDAKSESEPVLDKPVQPEEELATKEEEQPVIKQEEKTEDKSEQDSMKQSEQDNQVDETAKETLSETTDDGNLEMNKSSEDQSEDESELNQPKQSSDEDNDVVDDQLTDINSSLAKQISDEMEQESLRLAKLKKKKRFFKIQSGIILTLLCIVGFGFFLGFTKPGNKILMKFGVNIGGVVWESMTNKFNKDDTVDVVEDVDQLDETDKESKAPEIDASTIKWPDHPGSGRHEDGVYNILLIGEENIFNGTRGRTDSIVIATLNTNDKTVKLTSLMRDMYVQIPGYRDNKLNSAYGKGGVDLLYETIAVNFDIRLDGCVKVNFKNFQKIVDSLGGLEITLKPNEAEYLNTTNYISNKKYRNVKAGKQLLNGNQVMGYVRVRKTSTITGQNNDYGRTDRHRIVLNAIYEKCRKMNKADLMTLMLKFLPMIKTDIDKNCFEMMLNSYIDMGMSTKDIQQLRIPADHTFQDNIRVRGMSVLIPDLDANIKVLHDFIFSDQVKPTVAPTKTPTNKTGTNN